MSHLRSPGGLFDALVAAGLCLVGLYEVLVDPLAEDVVSGPTWLNVLAVVAGTLPLAWRRAAPLWVCLVLFTALAGRALAADPLELYATALAPLIAIYTVASYAPLRDAVLSAGFGALALSVAVVNGSGTAAAPDPLASAILYGLLWLAGRVVGVRHEKARELHEARDQHAAEAVAEERARIARELHDAVSHSLAAIVMQSAGAQNVLDSDPERVRRSLAAIESTGRRGLEEMRRMLGLLGGDAADQSAQLSPQLGLDRLDELVAAVRAAGIDVHTEVRGERRTVPGSVDVSAYRIVQEALTNVMKHAGARSVRVAVGYEREALAVEVLDDGSGAGDGQGDGSGRGLAGMRERVQLLGGTLDVGPAVAGWRVAVRLPLEGAR
jgi:signal transduction histidine kinase